MWDSSSATRMVFSLIAPSHSLRTSGWFAKPQADDLLREVEFEPEGRTFPLRALHEDPPAVDGLDNVLHERESQTGALRHPVVRLDSVELIEHKREVLGRNPHAGIGYPGADQLLGLVHFRLDRDLPALRRVLHRVAEKVEHRLVEHVAV